MCGDTFFSGGGVRGIFEFARGWAEASKHIFGNFTINEHLRNLNYPGGCTPLPDPTPLDSSMLIKQAHVHTVNIDIV